MQFLLAFLFFAAATAAPYDIVIRNGHIVDGTGSPWYPGDIGIRGGQIAAIGKLEGAAAKRTIDAHGMVVAPGFIDMLGQSELTILVNPHLPSKIYQGITTEITGEGGSIAPLNDAVSRPITSPMSTTASSPTGALSAILRAAAQAGDGHQPGELCRRHAGAARGARRRRPRAHPAELERMKTLVRDAMREGAMGVSTSLQYAPAPYATTEELIALAAESAKIGGIYASHIRDEGNGIDGALDEAFRIGREAIFPVEIWHLKAAGKANWGRMPEIVARIEQARRSGVDVDADTYAYPAWFNSFSAIIPPWAHDGGDKKLIERLKDPAMRARIRKEMETPRQVEQRVAAGAGTGIHSSSARCRIPSCCRCRERTSRRSRSCGAKIRSTPSSTC